MRKHLTCKHNKLREGVPDFNKAGKLPELFLGWKIVMRKCFRLPHFKIKVAIHSDSCYNIRIKERKETWLVSSESVVKYFLPNTEKFVIIIVQNQKGVGFSSTGAKKLRPKISHQAGAMVGRKLESSTSTLLAQS